MGQQSCNKTLKVEKFKCPLFKARIVLLVDLREIFFRFWVRGVGGTKSFETDQLAKNYQLTGLVIVRVF